jgi:hypothetical protein
VARLMICPSWVRAVKAETTFIIYLSGELIN